MTSAPSSSPASVPFTPHARTRMPALNGRTHRERSLSRDARGPVSGVGLITTLLALMSAAWILMTLEVAFVVRCRSPLTPPPHPRARPLLPYLVLPVPLSPDPRGLPRLQATCGVSWSIYVIVRQVHPPPSTRPRPKPRLPGPERCRAARVAGSPHPPEVWAQQGRHRHLRGHARCGGRQAVPPLVRGASSPEGGGSPPPPPALRRHWAPVAFEHAGPPAARKRSSTTTSRTRAQGSSRASRRRLARGQKARTTYEPRRLGATPCARTCCLRGTDLRPRVSFARVGHTVLLLWRRPGDVRVCILFARFLTRCSTTLVVSAACAYKKHERIPYL